MPGRILMYCLHRLNPANEFRKHFELVLADTAELRDEVFRVRHKVFCEELGFHALNAEGRERDEHDEHSRHLLLRSVKPGMSAGCIRLVLAADDGRIRRLPGEKICAGKIDRELFDPADLPRERIAEVSRLMLMREFRGGRRPESRQGAIANAEFGTPAHPGPLYAQLSLYLGAIALAHRLGIEALLFLIEPRLAALFRRLGFPFRQISGPVECKGTCVLSMAHVGDPLTRLPFYMRPFYQVLDGEIAANLDFGPATTTVHRFAKRPAPIRPERTRVATAHPADESRTWTSSQPRFVSMPSR